MDEFCKVEGGTTIISIEPDGTVVKKGEVVCELDSAALRDQLINNQIAKNMPKTIHQNARTAREVAETAVLEFTEGTFKQELNSCKGWRLPWPNQRCSKPSAGSIARAGPPAARRLARREKE